MIATETFDSSKLQIAPTPLKRQSAPKMAFDFMILMIVGVVGYSFGDGHGQIDGKLSQAGTLEEKDKQIKKNGNLIAKLEIALKASKASIPIKVDKALDEQTITINSLLQELDELKNPKEEAPPVPPRDGDGQGDEPFSNENKGEEEFILPHAPGPKLHVEPDDVERLFQSLQEEASGNPRVDDLVEGILKVELSSLEDRHESAMTTWKGQSADQVKRKQAEGAVTITMSVMRKLSEKSTKVEIDIWDMLRKEHEALKKLTQSTYDRKLVTEEKLTDLTNQIVTAKQELKVFKASRNGIETDRAASKKEHSDALTQIDSLNRETGSLEEKIKELSDGYSLHDTLSSNTWPTGVFEEAKIHARRIPANSKSLLDEAIIEKSKLEGKLVALDEELTVAEKNLESSREKEVFLEGLILEGSIPEGGVEKARQAAEAEKKRIQTKIDLLNDKKDALTISQGENEDVRTKLEADHSEAVKEQNDALAKIKLNEKILVGLFAEPVELEPSLALIGAIESELSKTTNNLNSVGTLINGRGTKLKGNITKLRDIKRKKEELEKSAFGDESETKKRVAVQELGPIVTQMIELKYEIIDINLQLKEKKEEKSKLLAIQAHLEGSLAFLKPGPPPPPTDKIVLIPQGDNISQCAFIVKQVPLMKNNRIFGGKGAAWDKFIKFHKEQVTHLQSTMQAVGGYSKLKAESGATDSEKYDKQIQDLFANALIESNQTSGTFEATLEATGLSGKLIVYGYARSESGTMKIYVRELDSKPARVPLESGIAPDFSFPKKK